MSPAQRVRDKEIVALYKAGNTRAQIAHRFGLTPARISQIVAANRGAGRRKGQRVGPYKQCAETHKYSRISYLPTQIANLQARLASAIAEARSYGIPIPTQTERA